MESYKDQAHIPIKPEEDMRINDSASPSKALELQTCKHQSLMTKTERKDKSKAAQTAKKREELLVKKAEYMRRAHKEKKVSNATERMPRARKKSGLTPAERKAKSRAAQSAEKREEQLVSIKEYKRRA